MDKKTYKHWYFKTDQDNVLWVYFDKHDAPLNTIDQEVMEEFSQIIDQLASDNIHKGVIITSGKKSGFIAGADISQFTKFKNIEEGTLVLIEGQKILDKLEALKIPTVAMIEGFCLGGGLELALACRYRVTEENKTRLGLPEVKLGIHPGWGGTVRLPRLIGSFEGLNLILSGHTVSGKAAYKLGFVDAAVPKRQLENAAKYYALNAPEPHKATFLQDLSNQKWVRPIVGAIIRKKLKQKCNPAHYPAPYAALDNWETIGVADHTAYDREAKTCGKLFLSETCQNLVRVFFLQEQLKGLAKKNSNYHPKHVHVIGAGTMGGDIAAWCAISGFKVTLQDLDPRFIAPAIKRAKNLCKEKFKKDTHLITKAMDQLIPDLNGYGLKTADVIIEAVVEDLAIKQSIFKMIEEKASPDAILATNTSSIPLDEINTILNQRERLVGIHFFNPVAKMLLVEIVKGEYTSETIFENAISFVRKIDRLPLPVKSSPGFLVNRILMPYLLESVNLLNEGIPASAIDKAMTDFGMPMGPITLADTVGLDVCLSVAKYLGNYYNIPVPTALSKLVAAHKLGKKSGEGFYSYDKNGRRIKDAVEKTTYDKPLTTISDRLVNRMLQESFLCLREGVVANSDLLDAGMIFGTGFAPFRGGPVHYAYAEHLENDFQSLTKDDEQSEVSNAS